jgi:hypothetical protein
MRLIVLSCLVGCGFDPSAVNGGDDHGPSDAAGDAAPMASDARDGMGNPACAWSFTPTNFDPCQLPGPAPLSITSGTYDLDSGATALPSMTVMQTDGSLVLVVHLASLDMSAGTTLNVHGSKPVILAVEGNANLAGTVRIRAGADDVARCTARAGHDGTASSNSLVGGGGGGGAAGAGDGGNGTDGSDGTHSGHGTGGARGAHLDDTAISPLVAGCPGGSGGSDNGTGTPGAGGGGGGGLQISAQLTLTSSAVLDASGAGGGGTTAQTGAGGGGSGGAIFLEANAITVSGLVCADGGSGGEGGGSSNPGAAGNAGACTGAGGATTGQINMLGGDGGGGGWKNATGGGNAGAASNASPSGLGAGGGGGGGSVGWIRLHAIGQLMSSAVVTPNPRTS